MQPSFLLRPSHAFRWSRCAASVHFEANVPTEPDSDAAREGTAAAWVADCVLKGDADSAVDLLGREHKNGWLVTSDMVEHVQDYIDFVRSLGGITTTEQFVRLNDFIAGTLDASTALSTSGVLHVNDLKYGYRIVDVFECDQLIIYGAAEMLRLMAPPYSNGWQPSKIILGIYQPRAFHPDGIYRTWELTPETLWQHANRLVEAGLKVFAPNPVATPGPQCRDCRAIGSCVAAQQTLYAAFQYIENIRQAHMGATDIGKELRFLNSIETILDARKAAIESEAETRLRKGEHIPGWGIKPRYGHRKFKYDPATIKALTGIDPTVTSCCTPAELERRGANVELVSALSDTPTVGYKLQPVTDKDIRKAFNK